MTGSSAVCMVQEEQDKVVYKEPVRGGGQVKERVDRPGTGGERLGMLEAWRGGRANRVRGLLVWPQNQTTMVSRFGPQN